MTPEIPTIRRLFMAHPPNGKVKAAALVGLAAAMESAALRADVEVRPVSRRSKAEKAISEAPGAIAEGLG